LSYYYDVGVWSNSYKKVKNTNFSKESKFKEDIILEIILPSIESSHKCW
jgi:hypothetical protein